MTGRIELAQNAAGRSVPTMVNGRPQIPYERLPHPFAPAKIIPRTATNAWPISKPLCATADCATGW